ncbi:MAG: FMN-binding protein [Tissierellia bacterium]|nr:FMN-binding protein [Tissierellia bacterium]
MFRRLVPFILAMALIMVIFTGCGERSMTEDEQDDIVEVDELQDGKYLVKIPVSEQGNYPMAHMEVDNGEIVSFKYSEILADSGEEKSEDNYEYQDGLDVIADLNEQFNQKKTLAEVDFDAVSGATSTKEEFKNAVNQLLLMASNGEVYEPRYIDGEYRAQAEEPNNDWLAEVLIVIREGQIVGIDYSEIAVKDRTSSKVVFDNDNRAVIGADDKPKTEPVEVKEGDKKSIENYAHLDAFDVMKGVQRLVIDNNGVDDLNLDAITGATGTRETMLELIEKALEGAV